MNPPLLFCAKEEHYRLKYDAYFSLWSLRYLGKVLNIRRCAVQLRGDQAVENAVNTI